MRGNMRIILASASPRRRELLEQIGLHFEVRVSDVEEKVCVHAPELLVQELSRQKAEAVFEELSTEKTSEDFLVIGADTVVAYEGRILGKPEDAEDAVQMLQLLQGHTHEVYTGVTLLYQGSNKERDKKTFHEVTKVHFYPMSRKEIDAYVETGEPLDKAGAYGIQGIFARYVKGIEGDYNNVVGLPVGRLYQEIKV
ncbi:MAG: Maf family protein [Bacteroidales bacterium]|nr:Maf family protein [Lachnoclostridium sp.]MCM1384984.1 Maf family protein [Lachnoclostridium sp.]MCM1465872.1 Maf family protein [Bacteroidales bacterium]